MQLHKASGSYQMEKLNAVIRHPVNYNIIGQASSSSISSTILSKFELLLNPTVFSTVIGNCCPVSDPHAF